MKPVGTIFCLVVIVTVRASHLGVGLVGPGTHGVVLQGPGSKASVLGPDGSHISGYTAGGTVVAPAHHGGIVAAGVAPGYVGVVPGSGHEGQYIPDYTEHLYDDGSYKGDLYDEHY
ncbi:hypothetical protein TcasGA2_TC008233 [Tribolium castaneum]|uniref:Uncharacterized protein n=1 Tax=Tribolium castaneum TaxID=7070 RepID=D2A0M0_TRICA|nr:PREDICTED: uncharacterized protein LOC103312788 isoform X1 [Tribolium castaneum]EFA02528.1 hypothetical protein TcasGA2_TC008233 [Tribolium castaneum]|eukprot:XP_008192498.1 PREDICTED: uncharacterized protein LOC103312788 isoform X1 [Tribolium castaneum]